MSSNRSNSTSIKKTSKKGKIRRQRRRINKNVSMPKTASIRSPKSRKKARVSRVNSSMSLTELQFIARTKGVPFGGLTKTRLKRKLDRYIV